MLKNFIENMDFSFTDFIGIQLISPNGFNFGDKLTFGCALSFAIHIIIQDRFNKDKL